MSAEERGWGRGRAPGYRGQLTGLGGRETGLGAEGLGNGLSCGVFSRIRALGLCEGRPRAPVSRAEVGRGAYLQL